MSTYVYILVFALSFSLNLSSAQIEGIYCGKQNCYDVLKVTRDADKPTIRKAYHALARTHHPDKQRTQEARKEAEEYFRIVNAAYEILSDSEQRQEYDYMLENPDEMYLNYYRYYRRRYAAKVDVRIVIVTILLLISIFQYIGQWTSYNQALTYLVRDPKHRNRAKQVAQEKGLFNFSKRLGNRRLTREEIKDQEEEVLRKLIMETVELRGDCSKPNLKKLLVVQIVLLPYTISMWLYWAVRWVVVYWILRRPYDEEAQIYITRRRLGLSANAWDSLGPDRQTQLLGKQLWLKQQYQRHLTEEAEKSRLQAAEDSQMKRFRRYVKQHGTPQMQMDEW